MSVNEWGLTERGFRRPTYTELLDALEYKARELFGKKANLTVRSPLGVFLRIFAWFFNVLFQVLEDVYNSSFIDTAVGASLYSLGKSIGLRLLSAQKASGYLLITGTPGTVIREGFLAATISGLQYAVISQVIIAEEGTIIAPIQAVATGPEYNVAIGTITQIVNPTDTITEVTNLSAVDGGRERETDSEYRDRYYSSVDFAGGVNVEAIAAEIKQNVDGIYSVLGYENDTDTINSLGLPAHSVEMVVYGGLDNDVAQAIFKRKSAGIQTYGNKSIAVLSTSGQTIDINFSRPTPISVYIKISDLVTSEAFSNENGDEEIKQALIDYIGGDVTGGLPIGTDVIFMELPKEILSVVGVKDFKLEISKDGQIYSMTNIEIGTREKAVTDLEKVKINEP